MRLTTLLEGIDVRDVHADLSMHITSISSDSRTVLRGGMFICIRGEHHDGHDMIDDAVARGAAIVVVTDEKRVPDGVPYVAVPDTRAAEAAIWDAWYEHPSRGMRVIAVTGTNGKTSVTFMLKSIFETSGERVGIITTVRAEACGREIPLWGGSSVSDAVGAMTTPDPEYLYGAVYAMRQAGVSVLIFEASSHALSQHKVDYAVPDVAVFTNLSEEHLDYHGTMDSYFAAKARLADMAGTLVINADDAYISALSSYAEKGHRVITCSADPDSGAFLTADVTALRREESLDGTSYIYFSDNAVFRMSSPIPGSFTVYNTMMAGTAAMAAGATPEAVREGIAVLRGVSGRLERVSLDGENVPFSVFVDYAHTPEALRCLLSTVRAIVPENSRIVLLFGCGGNRDRSKRSIMGKIASDMADFTVITSDNCRSEEPEAIIREIMSGFDRAAPHMIIANRAAAIEFAVSEARPGDVLILAGKGHEKYEITSDGRHPFDETELVRAAVKSRRKHEN